MIRGSIANLSENFHFRSETKNPNKLVRERGKTMKEKIVVAFSSGKDSAFLLGSLLNGSEYEVVSLITTCTMNGKTTSHHINENLLEEQAERIGIPLYKIKMDLFNTEQFEN